MWVLAACSSDPAPDAAPDVEPTPTEAPAADAAKLAPVKHERRTTRGGLALDNLDARITNLHANIEQLPENSREALIEALGLRLAVRGKVSDLDLMLEVAGDRPVRAHALLALHRFDEALEADPKVGESVKLARHEELDTLESDRRAAVEKTGNALNWMRLADVLAAQGKTVEADRAYWEALKAYRDVSPLAVADIQFRRGLLWGESGEDPERARALYGAAIERLPGFVRANVHLAELEMDAGLTGSAIERVRSVSDSEDPEPKGKLALWLEGEQAANWRTTTVREYDTLLEKHPLAFADHAAEFFLAAGETDRARELAQKNLDNRPTQRAKDLCERAGCGG